MSDLPAPTMEWLATHHGVITTGVLRDHDVGRGTLKRLLARGVIRHVAKGVFVIATAKDTFEQRCAVLAASHPSGFITGPTAGKLAGLRRMPKSPPLHIAVRHGHHCEPVTGVVWRQTTVIWAVDREERDGITVASWPRLAFDLAADLSRLDHLSVVNQLLHDDKVTIDDLVAIDRRLGHPARPGSGRFRQTLDEVSGSRPSDSHAADAERRRTLHRLSWQLEVVSEHDMSRPERIADELATIYRLRAASFRQSSVS